MTSTSNSTSTFTPSERTATAPDYWWLSAWLAIPLLVFIILASRAPAVAYNEEMNVDESQMMAQAMRLKVDGMPWRGMDGTTSGPLNSYFLLFLNKLGIGLDYSSIHAVAAMILATLAVFTYLTMRQITSRAHAFAAGAIFAIVVALFQEFDHLHFSSELVPALLSAAVLFCLAARYRLANHKLLLDGLAGFTLGAMPWTKLQSVFGAVAVAIWLGWQILRDPENEYSELSKKLWHFLVFAICATLPSFMILIPVFKAGVFEDFWLSYERSNLSYAHDSDWHSVFRRLVFLCLHEQIGAFIQGLLLFTLLWFGNRRPGWKSAGASTRQFASGVALLAVANVVAVIKPPTLFSHYEFFLMQPIAVLGGSILVIWMHDRSATSTWRCAGLIYGVCFLGLQLQCLLPAWERAKGTWRNREAVLRQSPSAVVVDKINALWPGVNKIVVWGWMPSLYVRKRLPPATRFAICHFLIDPGPARDHLRASFLSDIRSEQPDLIVDAVAGGCFCWSWNYSKRIGDFPEFEKYIKNDYVLASELNLGDPINPVRFWISRNYLAAHGHLIQDGGPHQRSFR